MIIHFASSIWNFDEDGIYIEAIINAIHESGATLAHDWISPAKQRIQKQKSGHYQINLQDLVREDFEAINRSDAVIIEVSAYRLPQGLQLGFALQSQKPILYLYRKSSKSLKDPTRSYSFGLLNEKLNVYLYKDENDLTKAVQSFIKDNESPEQEVKLKLKSQTLQRLAALSNKKHEGIDKTIAGIINKEIYK